VTAEVARTARVLAAAGLVEGFGHVSARLSASELAITSTRPLRDCSPADVHVLPLDAPVGEAVPLEAPMHAAVYAARDDVMAICRFHGRAAATWATRPQLPPRLHGLGLMAGELTSYAGSDLVADAAAGAAVAQALGDADCILLRANGAFATGATLPQAAVRAFFLEERCRVASDAGDAGVELSDAEIEVRRRWTEAETARAWAWLSAVAE
jgi:ribulose-5-phosphate 4-epimerase/fuculose-1-phosphate aldolase